MLEKLTSGMLENLLAKNTNRWTRKNVLIIGSILYALGFVMISVSLNIGTLLIFGLINSIGETITVPLFGAEQTEMMPEDKRASYIALSSLSNREAAVIAGGLITLSKFFSPIMMSATLALILLLGILTVKFGLYNFKRA